MNSLSKALILIVPVVLVLLIGIDSDFILLLSIGVPFCIVGIHELILDFSTYKSQVPFLILLSYIGFSFGVTGIGIVFVILAFASR